jgi:valyl-tRNA synthetase
MMANILRILHPFIPFFTESVWSKNKYKSIFRKDLILSSWPSYKHFNKFNKSQVDINNVIQLISDIRSTKAELKITPKLYCDVSFSEKSGKLKKLINNNLSLIKQVGRINSVAKNKINDKNSIDILVLKEKLSLLFNEDINLASQKERILQKIDTLNKQIFGLNNKLKNKAYLKNAPRDIVENDKKLIKELTIEDNKLRSIVSSIN